MNPIPLSKQECNDIMVGEAFTMATVLLVFTVVILAVVAYKLFTSPDAKITIPGGYKFEWSPK